MPCSTCTEVRPVPICFDTLTLGTVASNTAHNVYFKNLSTGRERMYPITSTGTDLIVSVADDTFKAVPGEWYEVRATLASSEDITTNVNITISATAYTCFLVRFTESHNGSMELTEYTDITLEV